MVAGGGFEPPTSGRTPYRGVSPRRQPLMSFAGPGWVAFGPPAGYLAALPRCFAPPFIFGVVFGLIFLIIFSCVSISCIIVHLSSGINDEERGGKSGVLF